jgi:hypothetical protein
METHICLRGHLAVQTPSTVGTLLRVCPLHPLLFVSCAQATLEEVTEADLLLHVLDASSPQVLEQRQAVLGVLRGLGVSQQRLQEDVIEVWNKVDMLPSSCSGGSSSAGSNNGDSGSSSSSSSSGGRREAFEEQQEEQPAGRQQEAGTLGAQASGGSGSNDAGEAAGSEGAMPDSSGPQEAAAAVVEAAGGVLPPVVAALLEAGSGEGAGCRPTALATSVVQGRGLQEVLAAVESKVNSYRGLASVALQGVPLTVTLLPCAVVSRSAPVCVGTLQLERVLAGSRQGPRQRHGARIAVGPLQQGSEARPWERWVAGGVDGGG